MKKVAVSTLEEEVSKEIELLESKRSGEENV